MKKIYLLSALALSMGLASCNTDGYQKITRTITTSTINIVTSINDGTVYASPGYYIFNTTMTDYENSVNLSSKDLIANNTSYDFNTEESDYKSTGYDIYLKNVTASAGNSGMEINNDQFLVLYYYNTDQQNYNLVYNKYGYYFDNTNIGNYTFSLDPKLDPKLWITIAKYDIGSSYRVNTFQTNTFFKGTTKTTYPMNPDGFVTDDITYRFIINRDNETNTYSADMILYNARFAAEMPMSLVAVLVEGLDVEFTASGVNITGENIIPKWYTNGEFMDLERYTFKSVDFRTTNDSYTSAEMVYQVGEDYEGRFSGKYIESYYNL